MKYPANLQEACCVIGTAKAIAKTQAAEGYGVQFAVKDLLYKDLQGGQKGHHSSAI